MNWQELFRQYLYSSVLVAATLEGLGLPLPAEVLFLAAAVLIHQGAASLEGVVFAAVTGNMLGSMVGFGLAYLGGQALLLRVMRLARIKPEGMAKVEEFFARYGAATIFLSRFVGLIRAAAIYSAGAARMAPWRFALYLLPAVILWNFAWAWLALTFGRRLPGLIQHAVAHGAAWAVGLLGLFLLTRLILRWVRGRRIV